MAVTSLINAGLIPLEAVTTMGINAKEGENPIGFFGTGLKYAIASLLRSGHEITIWRGLDRYDFAVLAGTVRGKDFDFITMTGPEGVERLGFTTHLGAKWEMWQAFRELYSNCLDEGGELYLSEVDPAEDHTCIQIRGELFAEAARGRERFFLATEPLYKGTLVDIHPGQSTGLYYRGVLVGSLPSPAAFTYNLKTDMHLTEDRTLKHRWQADGHIAYTIEKCTDRALIERILLGANQYENSLDLSAAGDDFAEVVLALAERCGVTAISSSAIKGAERWAQREARVKEAVLSRREMQDIADARHFLASLGYEVTAPVTIAETLGPDVFGMVKDGKIYIAKIAVTRGGNFLIGTLLEEHLHVTHGFLDESRRFQDFLIDLVVKFAKDAAFEREAA
jgi:hypothetical protein